MGGIRKGPFFKVFSGLTVSAFLHSLQEMEICTPNGKLKINFFETHVKTKFKVLKVIVSQDFLAFFYVQPMWVLNKQAKRVSLKNSFLQANTAQSLTPHSVSLHVVRLSAVLACTESLILRISPRKLI